MHCILVKRCNPVNAEKPACNFVSLGIYWGWIEKKMGRKESTRGLHSDFMEKIQEPILLDPLLCALT